MPVFQLPSGIWYNSDTNQVVPAPSGGTPQSSALAPVQQAPAVQQMQPAAPQQVQPPMVVLQPGQQGAEVLQLQNWLMSQGYLTQQQVQTGPGIYGPQTTIAVNKWQQDHGVDNSSGPGYWGPRTVAAIQGQSAQQPQQEAQQQAQQQNTQTQTQQTAYENPMMDPNQPMNGTPYYMGNYSLVKFAGQGPSGYANENTVWLVDPNTKTMRPFADGAAISNFFDSPVDVSQITVLPSSALMPGGIFGAKNDGSPGFQLLSNEYAINSDGTAKSLDYSASQIAARYGRPVDATAEQSASMLLDGFLNTLASTDAGVDRAALDSLRNDHTRLSYYINAFAYGGYTLQDVYRDIKAKQLGVDVKPISSTAERTQYQNTQEGRMAYTDSRTAAPSSIGALSGTTMNLSLYDLPEEAFKTLVPVLDYNSDEFKNKMNEIETSYYDILQQQINASTDQQKAVADYNWETFRKDLETNYGIQLSNNAFDAWNQIDQAYNQFAQRNLGSSGIQNEALDNYLKRVRMNDQNLRREKVGKNEKEQMSYYTTYATSKQIQDLVNEDQAAGLPRDQWRATKWGLVPSDDIKNQFSIAALKQKYPQASDADLQRYAASILDENGNYRSSLFQNRMDSTLKNELDKQDFQRSELYRKNLLQEEKAYKEFTTPDSPFLRDVNDTNLNPQPYQQPQQSGMINLKSQVSQSIPSTTPITSNDPRVQGIQSALSSYQKTLEELQAKAKTGGQTPATSPLVTSVKNTAPTYTQKSTPSPTPTSITPSPAPVKPTASGSLLYSSSAPAPKFPSTFGSPSTVSPTTKTTTPTISPTNTTTGGSTNNFLKNTWGKLTSFF